MDSRCGTLGRCTPGIGCLCPQHMSAVRLKSSAATTVGPSVFVTYLTELGRGVGWEGATFLCRHHRIPMMAATSTAVSAPRKACPSGVSILAGVGGGSLVQKGRAYSFVTGHPPIGRHQGVEGWCTWLTVRRVCESQSRHWGRWGGRASVRLLQLQSKEFLTAFFQILIFPLQFLF